MSTEAEQKWVSPHVEEKLKSGLTSLTLPGGERVKTISPSINNVWDYYTERPQVQLSHQRWSRPVITSFCVGTVDFVFWWCRAGKLLNWVFRALRFIIWDWRESLKSNGLFHYMSTHPHFQILLSSCHGFSWQIGTKQLLKASLQMLQSRILEEFLTTNFSHLLFFFSLDWF